MTLDQIEERMASLVQSERRTTREILELIRRAESVRLPETPPRETASVLQCETTGVKRAISTVLRRRVIRRAGGQCEYTHQGRRCSSRFQLEADHVIPKAKGGSDNLENLRCLCRSHNQMMAEQEFGPSFMARRRRAGN